MITLLIALCLAQEPLAARIDALRPRLAAEDLEVRSAAYSDLKKLVLSDPYAARPLLKARIADESGVEARAALQAALDALPPLELTMKLAGEARVGEAVRVEVRIRNLGEVPVLVVPALHGSDTGMRFPKYEAVAEPPKGLEKKPGKVISEIIKTKAMEESDFVELKPGADFDPYQGKGLLLPWRREWTPEAPGLWTVRLVVDYTGEAGRWVYGYRVKGEPDPKRGGLVAQVPHVKLEAALEVEVKPKNP